jgi:hypothetical protein
MCNFEQIPVPQEAVMAPTAPGSEWPEVLARMKWAALVASRRSPEDF